MSGAAFLSIATTAGFVILLAATLLVVIRLIRGPTLPDRILALDTLTMLALGLIVLFAIRSGVMLYLDIAISVGLVGFLATVALARYVMASRTP